MTPLEQTRMVPRTTFLIQKLAPSQEKSFCTHPWSRILDRFAASTILPGKTTSNWSIPQIASPLHGYWPTKGMSGSSKTSFGANCPPLSHIEAPLKGLLSGHLRANKKLPKSSLISRLSDSARLWKIQLTKQCRFLWHGHL